jgi:hypothetical protein
MNRVFATTLFQGHAPAMAMSSPVPAGIKAVLCVARRHKSHHAYQYQQHTKSDCYSRQSRISPFDLGCLGITELR